MDLSTILGGNRSGGRAHLFLEGGKFHHKGGVFGPPFLVELHTIYRNSVPDLNVTIYEHYPTYVRLPIFKTAATKPEMEITFELQEMTPQFQLMPPPQFWALPDLDMTLSTLPDVARLGL